MARRLRRSQVTVSLLCKGFWELGASELISNEILIKTQKSESSILQAEHQKAFFFPSQ